MSPEQPPQPSLLAIEGLAVEFKTRDGMARVIDDLSVALAPGETLGVVGESGCGKSMTALAVMGLVPIPPGQIAAGRILLDGENLLEASEPRMREVRGNEISMIFQEPMTSLNPVYSVGNQIAETARLHEGLSAREARDRAVEMLYQVGIPAPEKRVAEFPHQLSGGMRQRVMIAMALTCRPRVLIADEPTTALDVTVQAQIFDLLRALQADTGTSIIMITHDMGAIAEMAQRVVVMYAGRKVEEGPVDEILANPKHPYTQGLIVCVPHLLAEPPAQRQPLMEIPGVVPALTELGKAGCPFAPRCAQAMERCRQAMPPPHDVRPGHVAACWLLEEAA
ncbi:MAG TPA: ABC transporter ATP-binding protein [Alphaproteobacteria bacterium]|jgi:peptide/nickel transport system ATP-binding protein|nr:ABC transporter ATP-binding protein [Alphaproteobacteria bacterium]MDP6270618.1 ABC transporter ATP-binding protein [Alphaproteobacteria bacterium]HJM51369.1 ABC transporter ATP-binding protein [Alphaproteobacteria bacterium]